MRRLAILAIIAYPWLLACEGSPPGVPLAEAVASIDEADYLSKVEVIADDSMRGRADPSPELDLTAQWVADQFQSYGLAPGGEDGTYIQRLTMRQASVDFENSGAQVTGGPALAFGTDLSFMRAPADAQVTAGSVLVSGDVAAMDDFPADQVAGKHVILIPAQGAQNNRRFYRAFSAITRAGPASLMIVDESSDEDWAASVERARGQSRRIAPWDSDGGGAPLLSIRSSKVVPLLQAQGVNVASLRGTATPSIRDLPGLEIVLTVTTRETGSYTIPNTVGILEGSDPELKDEYIVFSGHMDHVGVGRPNEAGDSIRNGADDDASGTIAVVEVAEAFSMLQDRPRRSMIFLTVGGEEAGLLGSHYFVENPSVPLDQIVADLNADMISRNAPDSIVVIGKEHSDLGATLNRVASEHPELNLTAADDIWPEENFYGRSDHFNFARRGVPILFFFCGTHEDYHQPSDEVSRMDISKATRTTKLIFYLGNELANADAKPQWNPESRAEIVDMGGGGR